MKNLEIVCSIEDLCYPDYYGGHGHMFEPDNLVACLPFAVWVSRESTNLEIFEESIQGDYDIIREELEDQAREITDAELGRAFKDELKEDQSVEDRPFKDMDLGDEVYLYGHYHVFDIREEKD